MPQFRHKSLDNSSKQFRLLKLVGYGDGYMSFKLQVFSLEPGDHHTALKPSTERQLPQYSALSYVWGATHPAYKVAINGHQFTIRSNLFEFFSTWYEQLLEQWIWVDQMCIDQETTSERNYQVTLMADIYRNAVEVKAWLGRGEIQHIGGFLKVISVVRSGQVTSESLSRYHSLDEFESLNYWKRVWVTQEIVLSRKIVYLWGASQFSQSDIELVYKSGGQDRHRRDLEYYELGETMDPDTGLYLDDYKDFSDFGIAQLRLRNRYQEKGHITLFEISEIIGYLHCGDMRDYIYGMSALLPRHNTLQIDYEKSIEDVLHDGIRELGREYVEMQSNFNLFDALQNLIETLLGIVLDQNNRVKDDMEESAAAAVKRNKEDFYEWFGLIVPVLIQSRSYDAVWMLQQGAIGIED